MAPCGIEDLPDELMVTIFSHLKNEELALNARNVCTRWKNIADSDVLWKNYNLESYPLATEKVIELIQNMPSLKKYSNDMEIEEREEVFLALATNCKLLKDFSVPNITVPLTSLKVLLDNLSNLESLSFSISGENALSTEIIGHMDTIKKLTLFKNEDDFFFNFDILRPIRVGCPNLRSLRLAGFSNGVAEEDIVLLITAKSNNLKIFAWEGTMNFKMLLALCQCSHLSELQLLNFHLTDHDNTEVQFSESLESVVYQNSEIQCLPVVLNKSCLQLKNLIIAQIKGNTTISLKYIFSNCVNLETLHLSELEVTDEALTNISCEFLEELIINDCTGWSYFSICHLSITCTNLIKLFFGNQTVSEDVCSEIMKFDNLKYLQFAWCNLENFSFQKIKTSLPRLNYICMHDCSMDLSGHRDLLILGQCRRDVNIIFETETDDDTDEDEF